MFYTKYLPTFNLDIIKYTFSHMLLTHIYHAKSIFLEAACKQKYNPVDKDRLSKQSTHQSYTELDAC